MVCKCDECSCHILGKDTKVKTNSNGLGGKTTNPENDSLRSGKKSEGLKEIPSEYKEMWDSPRKNGL